MVVREPVRLGSIGPGWWGFAILEAAVASCATNRPAALEELEA